MTQTQKKPQYLCDGSHDSVEYVTPRNYEDFCRGLDQKFAVLRSSSTWHQNSEFLIARRYILIHRLHISTNLSKHVFVAFGQK